MQAVKQKKTFKETVKDTVSDNTTDICADKRFFTKTDRTANVLKRNERADI